MVNRNENLKICVHIYTHRHIYTHLHVSILYTEVRYILTPQHCFWKLLKIFRTVPTDLIRQLCRVEDISKSTLVPVFPSESGSIELFDSEEAAASTGTRSLPHTQQLLRLLRRLCNTRKQNLVFRSRERWIPSLPLCKEVPTLSLCLPKSLFGMV